MAADSLPLPPAGGAGSEAPQEIAKAHLLKAAPQLRDALEAVLAYTETCLRNACTDDTEEGLKAYLLKHDPAAWQMIVKARAALKATEASDVRS